MASHSHPPDDWIRVVICDDVPALRILMRTALESDPGLRVVGEAGDGRTGLALIERLEPDVVVLDLSMPGIDGLEAIAAIRASSPGSAVVVFSGFSSSRMRGPALDLGAAGYVEKGEALDQLRDAVRQAADRPAA